MALTSTSATIGGVSKTILVAQDGSSNIAAAHVTVDSSGSEKGTSGNPMSVSATALPLPIGAATAAKQPALGTAGTASADVITVQGVTSMTPLRVLQSGGTGTDFSANSGVSAAQTGTLLLTIPVTSTRAYVEVQNQSAGTVSVVRDDGAGGNQTLILLAPGAGANQQGGGWSSSTFKGRVRVYGASGSQVGAYQE